MYQKHNNIRGITETMTKSFDKNSFATGEKEFAVARLLYDEGKNSMRPVCIDNKNYLFTVEKVLGPSFDPKTGDLEAVVRKLADIHAVNLPGDVKKLLPTYSDSDWIFNIPGLEKYKHLAKELDRGERGLIHGDVNQDNIRVTPSGVVLIDFGDAAYGHPQSDLIGLNHLTLGRLGLENEPEVLGLYKKICETKPNFDEVYFLARKFYLVKSAAKCAKMIQRDGLSREDKDFFEKCKEDCLKLADK